MELLLKLGDNDRALLKAVESGDSDLIYRVLLKLKESMPLPEFQVLPYLQLVKYSVFREETNLINFSVRIRY